MPLPLSYESVPFKKPIQTVHSLSSEFESAPKIYCFTTSAQAEIVDHFMASWFPQPPRENYTNK